MKSPAEDFKDILVDESLGTFNSDLFVDNMPAKPDKAAGVFTTAGLEGELTMDKTEIYIVSTMIHVRDSYNKYLDCYDRAQDIIRALHGLSDITKNNSRYIIIKASSDILRIPLDNDDRVLFSLNFIAKRTPTN